MNPPYLSKPLLPFCAPGCWPWDDWERMALAAGLAPDLAALGRSLMREADQHCWCERLRRECGWNDEGRALLKRLLAQPRRTAARLNWLYATDGLRFDPWEPRPASGRAEIDCRRQPRRGEPPGAAAHQHHEYYEDSPCWKRLRARWDRERAKEARP